MARKMESKGARLLAILLALIMIGSVIAIMKPGTQRKTVPEREVIFYFPESFQELTFQIPSGADHIIYVDFTDSDPQLYSVLKQVVENNRDPVFFHGLPLQGINSMMILRYPGVFPEKLYLIDVNKTKVFFTHDSEDNYKGFKIKSRQGISLVDGTSPFLLGTTHIVVKTLDVITGSENNTLGSEIGNYTKRMPQGRYNLVKVLRGDAIRQFMHGNTSFFDFYLEAYRINKTPNGTFYEKVVLMNFIKNGQFVSSNKTAYYSYTNFKDGLRIAVMGDTNLTKLMRLLPEMRIIEFHIQPVKDTTNKTSSKESRTDS